MLTGEIRGQVDRVWDAFWAGGIANPLEVIEQITYLLFMRRLDEIQTLAENRAARLGERIDWPTFCSSSRSSSGSSGPAGARR